MCMCLILMGCIIEWSIQLNCDVVIQAYPKLAEIYIDYCYTVEPQ